MTPRFIAPVALAVASVLVLAGCASGAAAPDSTDDGALEVVASTNVYGDIAAAIGGETSR